MRRSIGITICLLLICTVARGGDWAKRLHPGLSWGYSTTLLTYHHYNYQDQSIGFRIDDSGWEPGFVSNGWVMAQIAVDIAPQLAVSFLSGYQGISKGRAFFPLVARFSLYPSGMQNDGIFIFADAGLNLLESINSASAYAVQGGIGRRLAVAHRLAIDVHAGIRMAYDRPPVWDPLEEEYIAPSNVRRNDAWNYSLNFGIALVF